LRNRKICTAWNALKTKLASDGSELSHNVGQLKMQSSDGKYYETDVLDTRGILRLVQSVPSKKAEPFKRLQTIEMRRELTDEWQKRCFCH
jgi:hypothetical protein